MHINDLCLRLLQFLHYSQLTQRVNTLEEELYQASQELREAESKARHASNQLNVLLLREKKMMKEKRDAQRQLDQAKLQIARNLR